MRLRADRSSPEYDELNEMIKHLTGAWCMANVFIRKTTFEQNAVREIRTHICPFQQGLQRIEFSHNLRRVSLPAPVVVHSQGFWTPSCRI